MPGLKEDITKLYYSISEVSAMLDVKPSLIRFWEKEFESVHPKKNKKGNRLFSAKDIESLKLIYHLVKEKGYTLDGAKKHLKSNSREIKKEMEMINRLNSVRDELTALKKELSQ